MLDIQIVHSCAEECSNIQFEVVFLTSGFRSFHQPSFGKRLRCLVGILYFHPWIPPGPVLHVLLTPGLGLAQGWSNVFLLSIRKIFCIFLANPHGIRTGPGPAQESRTRVELDLGKSRSENTKPRQESSVSLAVEGDGSSGNRWLSKLPRMEG